MAASRHCTAPCMLLLPSAAHIRNRHHPSCCSSRQGSPTRTHSGVPNVRCGRYTGTGARYMEQWRLIRDVGAGHSLGAQNVERRHRGPCVASLLTSLRSVYRKNVQPAPIFYILVDNLPLSERHDASKRTAWAPRISGNCPLDWLGSCDVRCASSRGDATGCRRRSKLDEYAAGNRTDAPKFVQRRGAVTHAMFLSRVPIRRLRGQA